jgi:transcriptional regulator with XRE-family HTH domain
MTTAAMGSLYATGYHAPEGSSAAIYSAAGNDSLMHSFACYLTAGTMGVLTPQAIESLYSKATSVAPMHYKINVVGNDAANDVELERSPSENLARVREVLNPTMLELANSFDVSRQAVYNWQTGAQPEPPIARRLAQLARVADVFADAGIAVDGNTLRRRVAGGGTLLDAVSNGSDAHVIAKSFVSTLKREAAQRERLQAQLAGRKRAPMSLHDYGSPAVSEDA